MDFRTQCLPQLDSLQIHPNLAQLRVNENTPTGACTHVSIRTPNLLLIKIPQFPTYVVLTSTGFYLNITNCVLIKMPHMVKGEYLNLQWRSNYTNLLLNEYPKLLWIKPQLNVDENERYKFMTFSRP